LDIRVYWYSRFYYGKPISGCIRAVTGGLLGIGYLYDLLTLNTQTDELNA